ncbi:hypothetical protein V1273_001176 [Bradyrhizobium sp. AZCC 1721]
MTLMRSISFGWGCRRTGIVDIEAEVDPPQSRPGAPVFSGYITAPFGLEWHREFAHLHGKRMSYPEWGVGNFGDNPFFIQQMHHWFMKNEDRIAYSAYFDVNGAWPTQIDNGQFPNSQRLFRKLFSR